MANTVNTDGTALFGEMTSAEIALLVKKEKKPVVILPLGALEAHGEHLPLWTDSIVPYEISKKVASQTGSLVLPAIEYGFCYTLRPWAGTVSLRAGTYSLIIEDIVRELVRNGFDRILIMNGHGGNAGIASQVLKELSCELDFTACIVSWWQIKELEVEAGHADEIEASLVMAVSGWEKRHSRQADSGASYFGKVFPMPEGVFSKYGYCGKVGGESVEKGRKMERIIIDKLVKLIKADLVLKE